MRSLICFVFCLSSLTSFAGEVGPAYRVDFEDAINHYVSITMTTESTRSETKLMMPTWTPGSYLVREYAKNIDLIQASEPKSGKSIPIEKISKNRWLVKNGELKSFQVKYRVYCNERSVRTNWVGTSHGVLNGAPTFLTVPEKMELPHAIELVLPKSWKKSATSLQRKGEEPHHYLAKNYDEVVDSPIAVGSLNVYPFKVANVEHQLVNINELNYWDGEKAARDLAKCVAEHHRVWGTVPYDRYLFLNWIGSGGGGLEHDNCCLMMSSRFGPNDEASYKRWLSTASHEFFHAWNVRRLRPKALVKYDYESEVYTPSLWVAEGITSYYEDLLLVRAGLITQEDFLRKFGSQINSLQQTEGRKLQSLRDSSHDAWIKYYRPSPNSNATQISYYTKGAVAGFLLDASIRAASSGKGSLDQVMELLYRNHSGGTGYLPADFQAICSQVAGTNLDPWFARAIDSTEELDYQVAADYFGLEIGDIKPATNASADGKKDTERPLKGRKPVRWLGIGVADSPASKAGLADSDEIIAVNGQRLRSEEVPSNFRTRPASDSPPIDVARSRSPIETRMQDFEVGDPIKILISREDVIQEILVTVGSLPEPTRWGLTVSKNIQPEQKKRMAEWLGQPKKKEGEAKPTPPTSDATADR